jgi:lysyl-tRNA synthetase class I
MSPHSLSELLMNLKLGVVTGVALCLLQFSVSALQPEQQAIIDKYKEPFSNYLAAVQELGTALDTVGSDTDLIKASDKFCDQANKFVDDFNENKERFAASEVVKSMDNDPDAKKLLQDYMQTLKEKFISAQEILNKLILNLNKYKTPEVDRVRNRLAATFQRIQILYM